MLAKCIEAMVYDLVQASGANMITDDYDNDDVVLHPFRAQPHIGLGARWLAAPGSGPEANDVYPIR